MTGRCRASLPSKPAISVNVRVVTIDMEQHGSMAYTCGLGGQCSNGRRHLGIRRSWHLPPLPLVLMQLNHIAGTAAPPDMCPHLMKYTSRLDHRHDSS